MNVETTQPQPFDPRSMIASEREYARVMCAAEFGDSLSDEEFMQAWELFSAGWFFDSTRVVAAYLRARPSWLLLTLN